VKFISYINYSPITRWHHVLLSFSVNPGYQLLGSPRSKTRNMIILTKVTFYTFERLIISILSSQFSLLHVSNQHGNGFEKKVWQASYSIAFRFHGDGGAMKKYALVNNPINFTNPLWVNKSAGCSRCSVDTTGVRNSNCKFKCRLPQKRKFTCHPAPFHLPQILGHGGLEVDVGIHHPELPTR